MRPQPRSSTPSATPTGRCTPRRHRASALLAVSLTFAGCASDPAIHDDPLPQDPEARAAFTAAERLLAEGELVRAVAGFRKCVHLAPSNRAYHVRYQDVALALPEVEVDGGKKEPAPATVAMRDYYRRLPDDGKGPLVPYLKARLELHDRREEPARVLFETALQRDEDYFPAQFALARLWRSVGKLAFAQGWLHKAVANRNSTPEAQRALAEVSVEMGGWADAARHYEAYLKRAPEDLASKRTYLSIVLYKVANQLDAAERTVQELLSAQPEDLGLRMDRAAVHWRRGATDRAIEEYRAVLKADPSRARAALNLGHLFYEKAQRTTAKDERRAALGRARTAYRYYRQLGETDDAFDWFDQNLQVPVFLRRIDDELGGPASGPARWQDI